MGKHMWILCVVMCASAASPAVAGGTRPLLEGSYEVVRSKDNRSGSEIVVGDVLKGKSRLWVRIVLTFDGAVGSVAEVVNGHYTGRAGGPFTYRDGKAQAIRELAEREDIDLAASWAYSDSESDLPMLRLVGHPVAVNPDAELARVAREEGWEVMRFERLGRRLRIVAAAAVGVSAVAVVRAVRA